MTGDEQFEKWRLQFSYGYDDSPYEYAKASWEASAIASRHETVEEMVKEMITICEAETSISASDYTEGCNDTAFNIIAAIRARYKKNID